jgi:8-oxo-dGTP pyrophosphatase MutT (NUDIX family)
VVQPEVATGVEQLSVTGVLLARDADGTQRVLLGKRSAGTRMYAGMWELGPAGGVEAPAADVGEVGLEALVKELAREVREESGLDITGCPTRAAALVHDAMAHSYDVVLLVEVGSVPAARAANWEYEEVRWVRVREVAALLRAERAGVIPPSRMLLEMLGRGEL